MAWLGTVWHELISMAKRGRKLVDFGLLNGWDFEFYKAFHLLRDGESLPSDQQPPPSGLTRNEINAFIARLSGMTAADFWFATNHVAVKLGERLNLKKPPSLMDLRWADQKRREEIFWLQRRVNPMSVEAQVKRRKIWDALVSASTYAELRKACGRWARLPDVRRRGLTCFPDHVLTNADKFLSMKQNKRFPKSNYGDDSRIEFLARGMAGVIAKVKPMTGIERLRNLKHGPGGPLWVKQEDNYKLPRNRQYCGCWRCSLKRYNAPRKITQTWYEDGLRLFMEVAASTKAPKEWNVLARAYS
jgi:hypothetical protein